MVTFLAGGSINRQKHLRNLFLKTYHKQKFRGTPFEDECFNKQCDICSFHLCCSKYLNRTSPPVKIQKKSKNKGSNSNKENNERRKGGRWVVGGVTFGWMRPNLLLRLF